VNLQIPESKKTYDKNKLFIKSHKDIIATGLQVDNEFLILKGSKVKVEEAKSIRLALQNKRKGLLEKGILHKSEDDYYIFNHDFPFGSPSTAAGVILGKSVKGRTEWKNEYGISLKE
jgi:hypothetical protein